MAGCLKNKFFLNWLSPYAIDRVFEGGAYTVVDSKGNVPFPPLNGK